MSNLLYKILWVDDQEFQDIEDMASEDFNMELVRVGSWEEAEPLLSKDFDKWSAIILDCYCKRTKNGLEDEKFLKHALHRLDKIAGDNRVLPWYVLSAGNRADFSMIIDQQLSEERLEWDADWEQIYYSKTSKNRMTGKRDIQCLLENILKVASSKEENVLRLQYASVIDTFPDKENELLTILKCLSSGESANINCYKQIRDLMEYIMDRIEETGILLAQRTSTNLAECSKALGQPWMQDFVPIPIQRSLHSLVAICNLMAHDTPEANAFKDGEYPYLLRGNIFELLSIIYWFKNLSAIDNKRVMHLHILGLKAEYEEKQKTIKLD